MDQAYSVFVSSQKYLKGSGLVYISVKSIIEITAGSSRNH